MRPTDKHSADARGHGGHGRRLTDKVVAALPPPARGNRIYYDQGKDRVPGFGVRVTAAGARSYVLNYRTVSGRERRYTIGAPPVWTTAAAREEARRLRAQIDLGHDPLGMVRAHREAPTVADLCDRFREEVLPKNRDSTRVEYARTIAREIIPELGKMKVADVTHPDIDRLHRKITKRGAPYTANRTVALLSRLFNLAVRWGYRADNPVRGVERNPEHKRERYLTGEELARLTEALREHGDQDAANAIRLMLLTGARRGEVLGARWDQFDLAEGTWTKPASTTKQAKLHRVPLNAPARALLADMRKAARDDEYLFPSRLGGHRVEIKKHWQRICKRAQLTNLRMHDLRHSFASYLASAGLSLPVIGALLGHTQTQTTARYAHLLDDPLRRATERVGAIIAGKSSGKVVSLDRSRR